MDRLVWTCFLATLWQRTMRAEPNQTILEEREPLAFCRKNGMGRHAPSSRDRGRLALITRRSQVQILYPLYRKARKSGPSSFGPRIEPVTFLDRASPRREVSRSNVFEPLAPSGVIAFDPGIAMIVLVRSIEQTRKLSHALA